MDCAATARENARCWLAAAEERENARYWLRVSNKVTGFGHVWCLTPEAVKTLAPSLGGTRRVVDWIRLMAGMTFAIDDHHDVSLVDRDAIDVEQFDGAKERVERLMEVEGLAPKDVEPQIEQPKVAEPQVVEPKNDKKD